MLKIIKISSNFYLIGGEYITDDFNKAVFIANKDTVIEDFTVIDYRKILFLEYLKRKVNLIFDILESLM